MVSGAAGRSATSARRQLGFTMIEILIAMAIGAVILAAVTATFGVQHRTYLGQDQVVEMQQNGRAAMTMLTGEIRQAGYDPDRLFGAGINTAAENSLIFSYVVDDPDSPGTNTLRFVRYQRYNYQPATGITIPALGRATGTDPTTVTLGDQTAVAENITRLCFTYLDKDDNPTTNTDNIRKIQVSFLVESAQAETKITPPRLEYWPPCLNPDEDDPWQAAPGNWNRYFTATILMRNLGL